MPKTRHVFGILTRCCSSVYPSTCSSAGWCCLMSCVATAAEACTSPAFSCAHGGGQQRQRESHGAARAACLLRRGHTRSAVPCSARAPRPAPPPNARAPLTPPQGANTHLLKQLGGLHPLLLRGRQLLRLEERLNHSRRIHCTVQQPAALPPLQLHTLAAWPGAWAVPCTPHSLSCTATSY